MRTTTTSRRAAHLALAASLALGAATLAACSDDEDDGGTATEGTEAPTGTAPAEDVGGDVERFNEPTEPVEVSVGEKFEIALTTDPAEGYTWTLTDAGDTSVIELQESQPSAIPGSEGDPGVEGAGTDVFVFNAVGAGETEISLTKGADYPTTTTVDETTVTIVVSG